MAQMLKIDALGAYYVEYDDETGEIINDPRYVAPEPTGDYWDDFDIASHVNKTEDQEETEDELDKAMKLNAAKTAKAKK